MTLSTRSPAIEIGYPDGDGQPMSESDPTRDYLIYAVSTLDLYFRDRPDVYVSGNLFIYYKQGLPDAVVSPDAFVIFGVEKKKRRSYKVWEEGGKLPDFVLEITSKTTQENDELEKPGKYQRMGVLEYFQYDPTGDYLQPALKGSRLVDGEYQPIPRNQWPEGTVVLYSESLELELRLLPGGELRFYDPQTGQRLMDHAETDRARREAEQARREAEQARLDAVPRLLEMGLSVEQVATALGLTVQGIEEGR
ncbi:MAG TPA: Uma2 family endonuclease [Thermosynechococcaceae cyanobacterium]